MRVLMFDLEDDPHETANLAAERPEILNEGAAKLADWHEKMMKSLPFGYKSDPMETVLREGGPLHANSKWTPIDAYKKRLRETGRGHLIAKIAEKHPEFR